jgi:serine/threonine protein phosphatase 1
MIHHLKQFFNRKWGRDPLIPRRAPDGLSIYAIGDIHGEIILLKRLLDVIERDWAARGSATQAVIVFLGDYIDRGTDSRGVLTFLSDNPAPWAKIHFLRGNHEVALIDFLSDPIKCPEWLGFGGMETLASFGLTPPLGRLSAPALKALRDALAARLTTQHIDFINKLERFVVYGDFVFVHAGIRPGVSLANQTDQDLFWIRDEFLSSTSVFEKCVVHGHTVVDIPEVLHDRISVDTGAYATGFLTVAVIHKDNVYTLQVSRARELTDV